MNTIDLAGRIAVVTGGARGIGFATAERLLRSGARVAIWDIDGARAAKRERVSRTGHRKRSRCGADQSARQALQEPAEVI